MSRTPARLSPRALGASLLVGCCALAWGQDDPCSDWLLPLVPTPADADLSIGLEYRGPPAPAGPWAFYGLMRREPAPRPAPLTPEQLAAPGAVPLPPRSLPGYARPVRVLAGWYDLNAHWVLYLLRLPAPDPRLERLSLRLEPHSPGALPAGTADKFHGPLLPKALGLHQVAGPEPDVLVCVARAARD